MTVLARIIGIDYGTKRIGVAVSDPLGIIAQPLTTIANGPAAIEELARLAAEYKASAFVIGLPLNLKGEQAAKAQEVGGFIERLKPAVSCEIHTWDERFTSAIAHRTLRDMGTTKRQRQQDKGRIDAMAAALILQSFLDSTKHSHSC